MRYLNDITASMADFVVSEQDYSGTLRQVMFESLNQLAGRLPPEVAIRMACCSASAWRALSCCICRASAWACICCWTCCCSSGVRGLLG